jgi:hypothetical protein
VSPLDVAGGSDAGCHCQHASKIALHDAKGEKPSDKWNRRKCGKT